MKKKKGPDFSSLSQWQEPADDGRTFCRKHIGHRYDPKKHTGCFLCYIKKQGLVSCDHCQFGYRKPQYEKCYPCFFNERQQNERNGAQKDE